MQLLRRIVIATFGHVKHNQPKEKSHMYVSNNCGSYLQTEDVSPLPLKLLQTSRFSLPADERDNEKMEPQRSLPLFKDRLRYLISACHLNQANLARDIGCSEVNVSRWVNGKVGPRFGPARALAKRLRVSLEWLLDGEGHAPSPQECFLSELKDWKIPQINKALEEALRKFEEGDGITLQAEIDELRIQKIRAYELIHLIEKNEGKSRTLPE